MKTLTAPLTLALGALVGTALAQTPASTAPTPAPALSDAEASRLFGLTLGEQLRALGLADNLQRETIERGLKEGLAGQKSSLEDRRHLQEYIRASIAAQAERNHRAAEDFLAKNAKEKGVHTTASGLEYKVLRAGDPKAAAPQATDQVKVNYRGTLLDGTEFDSSYTRGHPETFTLNGLIKGWQEGIALMKPGAKYQLFVPPELGYGPNPRPAIPGNSLLIFDVELLGVEPPPAAAGAIASPKADAPARAKAAPAAVAKPHGAATDADAQPQAKSITQP